MNHYVTNYPARTAAMEVYLNWLSRTATARTNRAKLDVPMRDVSPLIRQKQKYLNEL